MTLSCILVTVSGYVGLSNLHYVLNLYKFSTWFVGPLKIIHANTNVYSTPVPTAFLRLANFVFHLWQLLSCGCHILRCTHLYGLCKSCYLGLIFI